MPLWPLKTTAVQYCDNKSETLGTTSFQAHSPLTTDCVEFNWRNSDGTSKGIL